MAKIALFIVLVSMIMIHSAQVVVSDNEPSAAPIADVVAVAGPVSGSESSPAPAPTPETTTKSGCSTSVVVGIFLELDRASVKLSINLLISVVVAWPVDNQLQCCLSLWLGNKFDWKVVLYQVNCSKNLMVARLVRESAHGEELFMT
ncbi:hypothetical protein V6N11_027231 [Hibiscus sabdariffa]|uniref:Uncharacterized protein n=1 Tax=Hibiscus sabdariffa TaxID=183260 RepID=A0ABR2PGU7_9ROSI